MKNYALKGDNKQWFSCRLNAIFFFFVAYSFRSYLWKCGPRQYIFKYWSNSKIKKDKLFKWGL